MKQLVSLLQDNASSQGLSDATEEPHSMRSQVLLHTDTGCRVGMHGAKKSKKIINRELREGLQNNGYFYRILQALLVKSLPSFILELCLL